MSPDSLEDLKFVLKTISDIKDMSLDVENKILDLTERFRVMVMYDLMVRHTSFSRCIVSQAMLPI